MGKPMSTWVVVLVKDFDSAKQRLGPALDPAKRRALARRNATRAIRAAAAGERRLVVAGRPRAARPAPRPRPPAPSRPTVGGRLAGCDPPRALGRGGPS